MSAWWSTARRQLDTLALYLPLLLLLVMALGSWVLLRSLPDPQPDVRVVRASDGPDATWEGLRLKSFGEDGRLARELRGASGEQDNRSGRMRLRQVEYLALGEANSRLRVTARESEHWQARDEVLLTGQVAVDHQSATAVRTQLWTETLRVWTREERMRSEVPVRIVRAGDRFDGSGLDFNSRSGEYTLMGRVRAEIAPRHARASAPSNAAPVQAPAPSPSSASRKASKPKAQAAPKRQATAKAKPGSKVSPPRTAPKP